MRSSRQLIVFAVAALVVVSCGSDATTNSATSEIDASATTMPVTDPAIAENSAEPVATESVAADEKFPDIIDASATFFNGAWTFDVTVSSPYDSPERYADGWRVLGPDGTEYGFRFLTHDHAAEQPFTRSLSDVQIPADVEVVTIEGRDQVSGFGGGTFELTLAAS